MSSLLCLRATHSSRSSDRAGAAPFAGLNFHGVEPIQDIEVIDTSQSVDRKNSTSFQMHEPTEAQRQAMAKRALQKRARFVLEENGENGSASQLSEAEGQKYLMELYSEGHPLLRTPHSMHAS